MAWEFSYSKMYHCIHVNFTGAYTSDQIDKMRQSLKMECEKWDTRQCLLDFKNAEYSVNILDINRTPDYLKKNGLIHNYKYAILVDTKSEGYERLQMLSAVVDTKNYLFEYDIRYRLFDKKEDALNWFVKEQE